MRNSSPVLDAVAPLLAGVAKMDYKRFLTFDVIGDCFWAVSVTLVGYYIGSRIPGVDKYILVVIVGAVALSLIPTVYHVIRTKLKQR